MLKSNKEVKSLAPTREHCREAIATARSLRGSSDMPHTANAARIYALGTFTHYREVSA